MTVQNSELFAAVKAVVLDARAVVQEHLAAGKFVPTFSDWMKIDHFKSGFPHLVRDFDAKVFRFGELLGPRPNTWTPYGYEDWESFKELLAIVERDDRLGSYFGAHAQANVPDNFKRLFFLINVGEVPTQVFERTVHLHGPDFREEDIEPIYEEVETAILVEQLPIAIVVPIALTHFETPSVLPVADNVVIAKLLDDLQLARARGSSSGATVNQTVVNAATHALVLLGWQMTSPNPFQPGPSDMGWYPAEIIDRFFDALRVVTGLETGYAQAFVRPQGWARSYTADLPPVVNGIAVRRYPAPFERYGWLDARPPVTDDQIAEVAALYTNLANAPDGGTLPLAAGRLSDAMLRDNDRDSILDLVIGLEAILGDQTTTEVTHKLALRAAAVLARLDEQAADPNQVFAAVKHIYGYRSAVAHGNARNVARKQSIQVGEQEIRTVDLATTYLRRVIDALARRPELAGGADIDRHVILDALTVKE
ncbi:HEPN domain-containing protein [Solirubrobacter ginsenosidimutans]|uniref:HEPN domain-containing protein n=1 Tax=Solirubrobacter ginsenosidimutans TaxID=490573 RepID=A0A9X3S575_9ACTN|nr:HEPN domain-containing protein [Solirubrobacter ginsenosidimutans]MDA0161338.1 HEPN domain-containing protein [Solirubrobacter ginsenosidimutans]